MPPDSRKCQGFEARAPQIPLRAFARYLTCNTTKQSTGTRERSYDSLRVTGHAMAGPPDISVSRSPLLSVILHSPRSARFRRRRHARTVSRRHPLPSLEPGMGTSRLNPRTNGTRTPARIKATGALWLWQQSCGAYPPSLSLPFPLSRGVRGRGEVS